MDILTKRLKKQSARSLEGPHKPEATVAGWRKEIQRGIGPRLFFLLTVLMLARVAHGDLKIGNYAITHWTRENGLPDNSVTCLTRTHDGFLWIGTAKGLVRFDGIKFIPVELPTSPAERTCEITALFEDAGGRLWMGTRSDGLWSLSATAVSRVEAGRNAIGSGITCLAGDRAGDLWVGTTNGLARFRGTNLTLFTTKDGLPGEMVSDIHVSEPGTAWITTSKGMCQYKDGHLTPLEFQADGAGRSPQMIGIYGDQRGNLWAFGDTYLVNLNDGKRFNYFRSGDTMSLRIWSSCEGRNGQLWIGTSGQGLFSFAEGRFRPLSLRDASLGSDVQAIYEDAEGNLWLGTFSSGLVRLQGRRTQMLDADAGLPNGMVNCLSATADGQVWAGYPGEGLFVSKQSEHFERCEIPEGRESFRLITSAAATAKGELWMGTLGLGLIQLKEGVANRLTTETGLRDDEILAVAAQNDGSVWAGTTAGALNHLSAQGIESFGQESGLSTSPISCILAGASGSVFVGAEDGSLRTLVGGRFISADPSGVLAGAPVRVLCEDSAGRLWIGTQGKGLACSQDGHLTLWDVKAGFPDNEVHGILTDDSERLWVATRRGIHVMSPLGVNVTNGTLPVLQTVNQYDQSSLSVVRRGWPQAVKSSDGRLWFAGPRALYVVDPHDYQTVAPSFPVELESILVDREPLIFRNAFGITKNALDPNHPLRFSPGMRTLEIEFTTPNLVSPERVQFQHRLDNFDKDWVEGGLDRRVRYNGLPSGQYQFHVRAMNLDGTAGKENASLTFILPPPFWRAPSVIALASLLAVIVVVAAARSFSHRRLRLKLARLSQQEAMERERMRIARDMHDEIGSRLTRISYVSELALQDEVPSRQSIRSIAHTIRELLKTLDEIVWAVNPQNDTLENLADYFGHYVAEYLQNTAVECRLNIPPSLPACALTAETRHNLFLAFEEAVSNALRHSGATMLSVEMNDNHGTFEIRIQDNGRGFDPLAPSDSARMAGAVVRGRKGNGLTNIRQRLAGVGGEALIESRPGSGTTVTLRLPIKQSSKD